MATGFNISQFKHQGLQYGGARPTLFQITMIPPQLIGNIQTATATKFSFTASGASLPAAQIGTVEAAYFGRKVKFAGDRTFSDWTVTIHNDEDWLVRSMFELWSNALNSLIGNVRSSVLFTESSYKSQIQVDQFGKEGNTIGSYLIVGAFPTAVDQIQLSWESSNQIETFGVNFAYDYWIPNPNFEIGNAYSGQTGNIGMNV